MADLLTIRLLRNSDTKEEDNVYVYKNAFYSNIQLFV